MYHDVRNVNNSPFPNRYKEAATRSITEKTFKDHIQYIKKNYKVITLDELSSIISSGVINTNYAVLTFDDGLKDHIKVARFLYDVKLPATFFIPAEPILKKKMMKTHKIQFIIGEQDFKTIKNEILTYFPKKDHNDLWEKYSKSIWKNNIWTEDQVFITNILRRYSDKKKSKRICNRLFSRYVTKDEHDLCDNFYLSLDDISELVKTGFTIGGHGYTSENLSDFQGSELVHEFNRMTLFLKAFYLEKLFMSYPNGGFNDEILKTVNGFGYSIALATQDRNIVNAKKENILSLPRFDAVQHLII